MDAIEREKEKIYHRGVGVGINKGISMAIGYLIQKDKDEAFELAKDMQEHFTKEGFLIDD